MSLDASNRWLTLLANFGVIGGLVLIAMQMNFNTETIRLQNDIELNRGIAASELAFMGDAASTAYATAVFHPAELTAAQLGQIWAYLHSFMLATQNNWIAYRGGLASEASWAHAKNQSAGLVGFRAGRIWWEKTKWEYEPDFVKQIDAELVGGDPVDVERVIQQMLDEIRNLDRNEVTQPLTDRSSSTLSPSVPKT